MYFWIFAAQARFFVVRSFIQALDPLLFLFFFLRGTRWFFGSASLCGNQTSAFLHGAVGKSHTTASRALYLCENCLDQDFFLGLLCKQKFATCSSVVMRAAEFSTCARTLFSSLLAARVSRLVSLQCSTCGRDRLAPGRWPVSPVPSLTVPAPRPLCPFVNLPILISPDFPVIRFPASVRSVLPQMPRLRACLE